MRVIMITPSFAPRHGGVETHVGGVATALQRSGVDVEIRVHDASLRVPSAEKLDGLLVRRYPGRLSHQFPMSPSLWSSVAAERQPDTVVHVHSYHASASIAALRVPSDVPVAFSPHYHGTGHTRVAKLMHHPFRPLGRRIFRRAGAVVAVSNAEAELIVHDVPGLGDRVKVVWNAADTDAIQAADPWEDVVEPVVLVSGRLERYKRVDTIIEAFSTLKVRARLVITGDGPDRSRLEGLVRATACSEQITMLGMVSADDLRRWQRTACVVASASAHEAFGLVAVEGVAGGARALLSDIPAHREVLGILPTGRAVIASDSSWSDDLERLVTQQREVPTRVRSWADAAGELYDLYEDLLR